MEKNISLDQMFIKKLVDDYTYSEETATSLKKAVFENLPKELLINIYEWSNNKDLTDVKVFGVSILDLYKKWGNKDFILALVSLSSYAADPCHYYGYLEMRSL